MRNRLCQMQNQMYDNSIFTYKGRSLNFPVNGFDWISFKGLCLVRINFALLSRNEDHEDHHEAKKAKLQRLLQRPPPEIPV